MSSVLYGSVPDLVAPAGRARVLDLLHRHHRLRRAGVHDLRRRRRFTHRDGGVADHRRGRDAYAAALIDVAILARQSSLLTRTPAPAAATHSHKLRNIIGLC